MQKNNAPETKPSTGIVAYLIVREGKTLRDVYRLMPGQVTTIGRASTNRVVLRDEVCSRNHCEVFQSGNDWTLRDLGSRNGTLVNGVPIKGDWELEEGELIEIGDYDLGFTYDLSRPFLQFTENQSLESDTETAHDLVLESPSPAEPSIIHRTRESRYKAAREEETLARDRMSRELTRLYRLALEMGSVATTKHLAQVVLDGLFKGTAADIGAILLLPKSPSGKLQPSQLRAIAYHSNGQDPYEMVSDYLSQVVLDEQEAILARDVLDDSRLSGRDSLGKIQACSVICAPIRREKRVLGLIHLYSTNPDNTLDRDDLEFTLAVADQLAVALENLNQKETLKAGLASVRDENETLRRQLELETQLIGASPVMNRLRHDITRIAPTEATALVRGESGVGKELVARAIHFNSDRRDGPFVCMNCAALSESLLESELFGHERGSFTGATERKIGKFEQAHKGSLFLDEVGEMGLAVQAKFLRVLEGHPFERVGGRVPIQVDVRVIAATNRNLEEALKRGTFRQDLFFRLHVVELTIPPLRDRREDIPELAKHFLRRFAGKTGRPFKSLTPAALDVLMNYHWPGNVRELQNAVERAVILCNDAEIGESDIHLTTALKGEETLQTGGTTASKYQSMSLEALERAHILETLDQNDWNKSRASEILGIERSTLDRKLKRYGLERPRGGPD